MAITSLIVPSHVAPVYNPFVVVFESDNVTEPNFRFIVEIKNSLDGDALVQRYSIAPRHPDNIGYQDISNICQNLVSYQIPDGNFNDGNLGSYAKVKIEIGESYSEVYSYTEVQDNGGLVQLVGSVATTFTPGDQINISQDDGGAEMPMMEGLFTVISVSGNDVTVNRLWSDLAGLNQSIGGEVIYADNRKTEFLNLADEEVEFINASFDFKEFQSYDEDDWIQTDTTDGIEKLWSDANKFGIQTVKPTQDFFATVYHNFVGTTRTVVIRTLDEAGYHFYQYTVDINNPLTQIRLMGDFGTITALGGATLPVVKDGTKEVRVRFGSSGSPSPGSEYFTFYIDHRCTINDHEVMFLDLKGSWGSFAFQLKDKQTVKATKKSYKKELGTVASTGFSYELNDSGLENFYARRDEELEIVTNWMSEENSLYFDRLISSPKTLIKIDDVYYACEVTNPETQRERFQNKHLIQKTITIKMANSQRVNG